MLSTMDQYLTQMRHAIVWHRAAMEKARANGYKVIDDEIIHEDIPHDQNSPIQRPV